MSKIHLLSEHVCNQIAAGEVVERPASVVKELVENSIDAGAEKLTIVIEKAGQKLIRVQDNGEGMDADDALLCLESHATSKIRDEADIFAISSLGFRGEAVPSIASVSKFTIRTKKKSSTEGTEVVVNYGKVLSNHPAGCAPGTEISVRDLFCNLPARKKFMRSDATEERHILECVTNIALAHTDIAFELKIDSRTMISSPASENPDVRIRDLFGKTFADSLLPVERTEYGIRINGFISKRSFTRTSRIDQRIFVNGRCIEAPAVYRGIRDGYGPLPDPGRYPAALIFITMSPADVDVNVHPTKKEVRFRHEFEITSAVRSAVTQALRAGDTVLPAPGEERQTFVPTSQEKSTLYPDFSTECASSVSPALPRPVTSAPHLNSDFSLEKILEQTKVVYSPSNGSIFDYGSGRQSQPGKLEDKTPDLIPYEKTQTDEFQENPDLILKRDDAPARIDHQQKSSTSDLKLLGVMENTYLVGTIPGGLVLIDQHAAHERVLFERILKGVDGMICQKLLLPITIDVSRADMLFITRNRDIFEKIGFEVEPFGTNTVKLNGIPAALPQNNAGGMFQDILSRLAEDAPAQKNALERIARAACKAAVKAHDNLTDEECRALIKQLSQCELPYSCPHGRPTILHISMSEIERRFGRK